MERLHLSIYHAAFTQCKKNGETLLSLDSDDIKTFEVELESPPLVSKVCLERNVPLCPSTSCCSQYGEVIKGSWDHTSHFGNNSHSIRDSSECLQTLQFRTFSLHQTVSPQWGEERDNSRFTSCLKVKRSSKSILLNSLHVQNGHCRMLLIVNSHWNFLKLQSCKNLLLPLCHTKEASTLRQLRAGGFTGQSPSRSRWSLRPGPSRT